MEKRALLSWFFYGPIGAFIVFGFNAAPVIDSYRPYGSAIADGIHVYMDVLGETDKPQTVSHPEPSSPIVQEHLLPRDELTIFYSKEDQERIREARRQKHQKMMDDVRERYSREKFRLMRLRKLESQAN